MIQVLVLAPLAGGILALALGSDLLRRMLLLVVALLHASLVLHLAETFETTPPEWHGLLRIDALGFIFLGIVSLLFLAAAVYAQGYLRDEAKSKQHQDIVAGTTFRNTPERIFTACLLFFLSAMTLVTCTTHLGLLWVGVETTTLASAPLIYFHRQQRSLEATWKYLMICSVGIALALLGNLLLSISMVDENARGGSMLLADLLAAAPTMQPLWLKAAFIFLLVGYGTKMGLAPMHNWLPDAHSESPSLVSALLSGALLNCAFLGILRAHQICTAAGLADFSSDLLVFFGLFSMAMAAVFIVGQGDYKRLLAYSSVEHMGILALGVGIGGGAAFGAMLHAVNHSLTKAGLFFLAGNILARYHTKSCYDTRGMLRVIPWTGVLWTALFLSIVGSPPFGTFVSEFTILKAMLDGGRIIPAVLYLLCLAVIFTGMSLAVVRMVQGPPPKALPVASQENVLHIAPPLILGALVLSLGLYLSPGMGMLLLKAASLAIGNG